jgi:hypothetical protein
MVEQITSAPYKGRYRRRGKTFQKKNALGDLNRIKHLSGTWAGGLNGTSRLSKLTVLNDANVVHTLFGNGGVDWCFVSAKDKIRDGIR